MTMGKLNIASWGLWFGAVGQSILYESFFPLLPTWAVFTFVFVPWLTTFTISFCQQPPFGPRSLRHALVFAMCWYAVATVLAEILYLLLHPASPWPISIVVAHLVICLGGL